MLPFPFNCNILDRKWYACHANSGRFFVKMLIILKLFNIDMQKRIEYFRS